MLFEAKKTDNIPDFMFSGKYIDEKRYLFKIMNELQPTECVEITGFDTPRNKEEWAKIKNIVFNCFDSARKQLLHKGVFRLVRREGKFYIKRMKEEKRDV